MNTGTRNAGADDAGYYKRLQAAVEELLVLKGIVARQDIDREVAEMESRSYKRGAAVVARAWADGDFKKRLLTDASSAVRELGFEIGALHLIVVENTPHQHNVIVCTLCSCYPRTLLGIPPDWYKSIEYRSRVVHEPRAVLREFGLVLPESVAIRVHDSTADMRYMVLPMCPGGTSGWPESRLADLVTPECLIGTGLPLPAAAPQGAAGG